MPSIAIKSTDMDIVFSFPSTSFCPTTKWDSWTHLGSGLICLLAHGLLHITCKQLPLNQQHTSTNPNSCVPYQHIGNSQHNCLFRPIKKIKCKGSLPTNIAWCAPPPTFYTTSNLKNQPQAGLLPCHLRPRFHRYKTKRNVTQCTCMYISS